MARMKYGFITIIVLGLLLQPCFAEDFYFSQSTGNDTDGDGTEGNPWQTLAKINSTTFGPGDNIYLKAGDTWTITSGDSGIVVDFNGGSTSRITITSYGNGHKPVITASGFTGDGRGGLTNTPIRFEPGDGDYVTIDGLDLVAAEDECAINGYGNVCAFNAMVLNCDLSGDGFDSESLFSIYGEGDLIIRNNTFEGSNGYSKGLEVSNGANHTISQNVLINCAALGGAIRTVHTDGGCKIDRNYIKGGSSGASHHWGIVVRDQDSADDTTIVSNNIVDLSDSSLSGSHAVVGYNGWVDTGSDQSIVKLYNNSIYLNDSTDSHAFYLQDAIYDVRNNLGLNTALFMNVTDNTTVTHGYNGTDTNNEIDAAATETALGYNVTSNFNLTTTPPVVVTDFQLLSDSDLINAGTSVTEIPSDDYWGDMRSLVDIGADEYVGSSGTDIDNPSSSGNSSGCLIGSLF